MAGRESSVATAKRVLQVMRRHPSPLLCGIAMIFLVTLTTLLEPRLFGYAIDDAILPKDLSKLSQLVAVYFILVTVRVSSMMGQAYFFIMLGQRISFDLRNRVFAHLQRLPLEVFDKNRAGSLMTRVTNDVASFSEIFSAGFVTMVSNSYLVVGILLGLLVLDLKLGLIAVAVFPILVGVAIHFSAKLQGDYRQARGRLSTVNAFLGENLMGMKVIHLFNRQKHQIEKFNRLNRGYADAQIRTVKTFAFFHPSVTLLSGVAMALVIGFGTRDVFMERIQLGVLVTFFAYIFSMFQPIRDIADKWNIFLSGMAAAERLFSVLEWPTELEMIETPRNSPLPRRQTRGHLVFENVWFAYRAEHWALRDFSCEILPGQRIGVVGHTGSGKTTMMSLLLRFYEAQRGRIFLDGKDIRDFDKRELRSLFGMVQQDVFLFSGSIAENLSFWGSSVEADRFPEILGSLGYSKWAAPEGASTVQLQERASNLSAGEKQIVSMARVLAADPGIWILDEATANLDVVTEQAMQRALERFAPDKTTLLIAHRLATVKDADQILVLNKGSLVEKGSHVELLRKNGLYARMYRVQGASAAVGLQ